MTAGTRGSWLLPPLGLAFVVTAWEVAIGWFRVPPYVVPAPHALIRHVVDHAGLLGLAAAVTAFEAVSGFVVGSALGLVLAIVFLWWPPLERAVLPLVAALNSVPVVAFAPVVVIWFGIGFTSKIVLVTAVVGFTVLLNSLQGLKRCDPAAIALLQSFGAGRVRILRAVQLPHAMPAFFTGLRLASVRSMITAIVAEMLGAYRGIGWSIFESTAQMDFLKVWAVVMVASGVSVTFYLLVVWLDRLLIWWREVA